MKLLKNRDTTALRRSMFNMSTSVIALVLAFAVGGVLVMAIGVDPFNVIFSLFSGGLGGNLAIAGTLNRMAPILMAGLAITLGNSCGVFNIGFECQFLCAALAASVVGRLISLPPALHMLTVFSAAVLAAAAWSIAPITLSLKKGVNVVFSAIMLNYVAKFLVDFLIQKIPEYSSVSGATPKIRDSAILPNLISSPMRISTSVVFSVLMVVVTYILLFKTRPGYEMRAVGQNPFAALSAGIQTPRRMFLGMMLSASCAGIAAALEIMGSTYKLSQEYNPGYIGMGIAVAMLGKQNPFAILLASFLFAAMKNGATLMQMNTGVSAQFIMALQGLIIIFVCSENFIRYMINKVKINRQRRAEEAEAV